MAYLSFYLTQRGIYYTDQEKYLPDTCGYFSKGKGGTVLLYQPRRAQLSGSNRSQHFFRTLKWNLGASVVTIVSGSADHRRTRVGGMRLCSWGFHLPGGAPQTGVQHSLTKGDGDHAADMSQPKATLQNEDEQCFVRHWVGTWKWEGLQYLFAQCKCHWKCRRPQTRPGRCTLAASGKPAACVKISPGYQGVTVNWSYKSVVQSLSQ